MKKIYLVLTLMLLCIGQILASKTIQIGLTDENKLKTMEFRDGGPDGPLLTPEIPSWYPQVTVENGLWIHCTNPDAFLFVSTYQGGEVIEKKIVDQSCFYTMDELDEDVRITINLSMPRFIYVNIDDPSIMKFTSGDLDSDPLEVKTGENRFRVGEYDSFYISVADPKEYKLTSVYNETQEESIEVKSFSYARVSPYASKDGDHLSYTVVPASEFAMPKVKIRVDEPADAVITLDGYEVDGLKANEWIEVELPKTETDFRVSHKNWRDEIYKVLLNGESVSAGYSGFNGSVKDGDELDVVVYPEAIDYTVTVKVEPSENAPFIHNVMVDEVDADHQTGDFTVRNGKKIQLNFLTDYYELKGIAVNDKEVDIEGEYIGESYKYKVTGDAVIVVTAEKKPTYTLILDIDNPQAVKVSQNYNPLEIKEGENLITYTSSNNRLMIKQLLGSTYDYFAVVKDGVETEIEEVPENWELRMDEAYSKVIVRVTPLTVDKRFVAYFDTDQETMDKFYTGYSFGSFSFYSSKAGGSYNDKMTPGYTIFDFADVYLPYYWSCSVWDSEAKENFTDGMCYVDGEIIEKGYSSWELNDLKDGSVVKCYITKEPRTFTAEIEAEEDVDFTLIKDRIVNVVDHSSPIEDLEDTEIEIIPAEGQALNIYVADPADVPARVADASGLLAPNEDGRYVMVLDGNKKVTVKKNSGSGIGEVSAGNNAADVYTSTGVLLIRKASREQIEALPAGIYVVGGKKVIR